MSAHSPVPVADARTKLRESAEQSSDRLLRENAAGWLEHFAMHAEGDTAEGIYRFLCRVKGQMERERGFGRK